MFTSGFLDRLIIIFYKVEYEWEGPRIRLLEKGALKKLISDPF